MGADHNRREIECRLRSHRGGAEVWTVFLCMMSGTVAVGQADLAKQAAAANKASVAMIQSLYADVDVELIFKGDKSNWSGRYWRVNDLVRMEETVGDRRVDILHKDGRVNITSTIKGVVRKPSVAGWIIGDRHRRAVSTDAWEWCLFTLPVSLARKPPFRVYSLSEAVQEGRLTQACWETLGGARVARVTVELEAGLRKYDVWIDPAVNWLVRKCTHEIFDKDGKNLWRNEHRTDEFVEAKPTIYVPFRSKTVTHYKNGQATEIAASLRNLRVNGPLPTMPPWSIPAEGVRVVNEVDSTTYMVDRAGQKLGKTARLLADYHPPIPQPDPSTQAPSRLYLGLILLGVAGAAVLVAYKLRRRSRA